MSSHDSVKKYNLVTVLDLNAIFSRILAVLKICFFLLISQMINQFSDKFLVESNRRFASLEILSEVVYDDFLLQSLFHVASLCKDRMQH